MDVGARHPHNLGGARRQEWGFPQIAGCQQGGGGGGCHGDADMYPWSRGRSGGLSDIDAIGQFSFLSEGTKPSQGPAMVCQAVRCRLGPQRLGFGSCSIRPGAGAGRRPPPPNGFQLPGTPVGKISAAAAALPLHYNGTRCALSVRNKHLVLACLFTPGRISGVLDSWLQDVLAEKVRLDGATILLKRLAGVKARVQDHCFEASREAVASGVTRARRSAQRFCGMPG